jgi:very-short-patch-repair endonuclease
MSGENSIHAKFEKARHELLDLTARNRLINTSRSPSKSGRLEIVDEISQEVFRHLFTENKVMSFLPKAGSAAEGTEEPQTDEDLYLFAQPDDENEFDANGLAARHTDNKLQTRLTSEGLQRRLLKLFYESRTYEEEQGVSILYLVLGFLKWYESDKSDKERFAPLLLIPVELERKTAGARFTLRYAGDEITTNLSLQAKLKLDFGINLPDIPDTDDLSPDDYFEDVQKEIESKPRWEVLPNDSVLWFFSFAKFLMYRDLKPETWPAERPLEQQELITSLLGDGFRAESPIVNDSENIDSVLQPLDLIHVMDADSSQTVAIEEVKRGRNLVIQGPPGTGKSQTIANMIAASVCAGKRVLFVAEKMAALEVVKRRLDNIELGDMCLELHSHKANKKAVLDQLKATLNLGRPQLDDIARQGEHLRTHRDRLNQHARNLHTSLEPANVTPFQILGELVRLTAQQVDPAEFKLDDAAQWSRPGFHDRKLRVEDLSAHMAEIGNPKKHPWRGVRLEATLPTTIARIAAQLPEMISSLDRLMHAMNRLAALFQIEIDESANSCDELVSIADHVKRVPKWRECYSDSVWNDSLDDITSLVDQGKQLGLGHEQLSDKVADVAWSTNVNNARRHLAAYGRSFFRFFNRRYREAQATLRGILTIDPPKPLKDRLQLFDTLIQAQKATNFLERDRVAELGQKAFGENWRGTDTNWDHASALVEWEEESRRQRLPTHICAAVAVIENLDEVTEAADVVRKWKQTLTPIRDLFKSLNLNAKKAFGETDLRAIRLPRLKARLESWLSDTESLSKWIDYYIRLKKCREEGMSEFAAHLNDGRIPAADAVNKFQMAYYEEMMAEAFREVPDLAEFSGLSHERILEKFKELDEERIRLARQEVAHAHFETLSRQSGSAGEMGIVRHEMNKKRRHLPPRKLLKQAGHAVQAIKPVFMMSPISVAQFLEPGALKFDILLIDEASQVRPVDALGAIARAEQIVVVGDDKQLPPSRFFDRLMSDDGGDSEDGDARDVGDLESILGLCAAQNVSQRILQWHYRSRHHSLIAVSNREFYDDRLFVVPSPVNDSDQLGLFFHPCPDGTFDRGGSRTNRVEAQTLADACIEHAQQFPDKTLGVGAFSVAQRDAILDELELRRRSHPELESFFAAGSAEPFFVKNLENIQGDERDVIFISVGYAKDSSGFMSMNFGPLSNDGGERRLNVLITRSRERCVVFSSIIADDIDLNRGKSRGAKAFKTFLEYARTGNIDIGVPTQKDFDSEFERQVATALTDLGYEVHPQVGVSGFFIDLSVVDPDRQGRYLLGIECDGASYHSSRSARDRDRLRQQVLEDRGWIIHRIWSTDWFHRPDEQLNKTVTAIESAKVEWSRRDCGSNVGKHAPPAQVNASVIHRNESDENVVIEATVVETEPYLEADFVVQTSQELHEVDIRGLAKVVAKIVAIESPIHQDEIARRAATLWGLKRTGNRIVDAVESAISEACDREWIEREGIFLSNPKQRKATIRNREDVKSSQLRKPELLPPAEIREAITVVISRHVGITRKDASTEIARLFGFRSTSATLKSIIDREIEGYCATDRVEERDGKLYFEIARVARR